MSTGSFDDSSNLVVEVSSPTSPTSPENALFDKTTSDVETLDKHSKKSKGFGFLGRRAKSPLKSPIKSPFKIPFKSSSKPTAKSAKLPSKEVLTCDVPDIEEKIADKKGEEWQVFQQMQDRIKQTVLKSQTTLKKLSSDQPSAPAAENQCENYEKKETSWTSFDDSTSLICRDSESNGTHTATNVISYEENSNNTEIAEHGICPVPRPPQNSLTSSMEDILNDNIEVCKTAPVEEDVDLLGLSDLTVETASTQPQQNIILNQDLLGLDSILSSSPASSVDIYPELKMEPSLPNTDFIGTIFSRSQFSQSLDPHQEMLVENVQVVPKKTSSNFTSSLVDEFLQLDNVDNTEVKSTDASTTLNPFFSCSALESQTEITVNPDLFIDEKKINNPDVVAVEDKKKSIDPFESINPFPSAKEETLTLKQLAERNTTVVSKPGGGVSEIDAAFDQMDSQLNFFEDSVTSQSSVMESHKFGATEDFDVQTTTSNPFLIDDVTRAVVVDTVQQFDDFFGGKVQSDDVASATNMSNIWGGGGGGVIDTQFDTKGDNPFQDDLFTTDKVPEQSDSQIENTNPFLSDSSVTSSAIITRNPFLELDSASPADSGINLSDTDKFLVEHKSGEPTNMFGMAEDDFDPFGMNTGIAETTEKRPDAFDVFTAVSSMGDQQLVQSAADEDDVEEFIFNLEIRPADKKIDTMSPPLLIQQPPRENPFDRDSPPEENFAKFEILGDKGKPPEPTKSLSVDSSTSEEYEAPSEPLEEFHPKFEKDGWKLMLRQPPKKKLTGNRFWKDMYVKIVTQSDGPVIKMYCNENDDEPFKELPLQPCYSLSDIALQQYDQYGKIYTLKMQYVFYKERVGIRTERMTPAFVRKPKPTMMLDHSPQVSELLKFGCLDKNELRIFVLEIENALMRLEAHREKTLTYTKDEVTVDVFDEFKAIIDKNSKVLSQKARVRVFVLAFLTGMPCCELGINDKRRKGKEVVGRHDIMPIKTEEWIRYEDIEFHCCVDQEDFKRSNNVKLHPLDACQFEVMRFRVQLRDNKELPLQLTIQQIIKGTHVEIRCDILVTGYHSFSKKHGQFPCEDIEIRFPIPEKWIYLFRYERRFGYGSLHSSKRKPGKIKGLERITAVTQGALTPALMEADVGTAKYENVCRCVVWRIPRLPDRNEGAYTNHLFHLTLDLGPHDEVPESYEQFANVEFTMPASTVSQTQVRSISVDNPNPPEKWVRYLAKYEYKVEIDHIQQGSDSGNGSD